MNAREQADLIIEELKDGLVKEKGILWSRKIVLFIGLKAALMAVRDDHFEAAEQIDRLIITDLIADLRDEFPDRDVGDLADEFAKDGDLITTRMLEIMRRK